MTETETDLVCRYLPRALGIARTLSRRQRHERDDLDAVARLGLTEAIRGWPGPTVVPLDVHVYRVVRCRVVGHLRDLAPMGYRRAMTEASREARRSIRVEFLSELEARGDGGAFDIPVDDRVGWECEACDYVESMAAKLSPRRGEMIRLHYLNAACESFEGCAERMGVTRKGAWVLHDQAIRGLRRQLVG